MNKLSVNHLLGIKYLNRNDIQLIFNTADNFKKIINQPIKKVPSLRDITIANLFFENSTRTKLSFEIAEKRLSADVINFSSGASSVKKGETLLDTVNNILAMKVDMVVMRHPNPGASVFLSQNINANIINAGDGTHEHPTQALLDAYSIREKYGDVESKKVVIVGAGPAGLEAARVAAARGHEVIVFEAQSNPGGQIRLTAQNPRRREMMSIIDWRMAQCAARNVEFRFNNWAEAEDIISLNPDIVIIATGGLPNLELFENRKEIKHVISTWDIISGDIKPLKNILIYDESGDHPALQAAEIAANTGAKVEIMTPDRTFSPEIMAMNLTPYMRVLQNKDVTFTVTHRLLDVELKGNELNAKIGTDYSEFVKEAKYDQIIVNYGTMPLADLYFDLKSKSINNGAVDYDALIDGVKQNIINNTDNKFKLFRIGDAVSSRNTHAAIYDALRLVKDL